MSPGAFAYHARTPAFNPFFRLVNARILYRDHQRPPWRGQTGQKRPPAIFISVPCGPGPSARRVGEGRGSTFLLLPPLGRQPGFEGLKVPCTLLAPLMHVLDARPPRNRTLTAWVSKAAAVSSVQGRVRTLCVFRREKGGGGEHAGVIFLFHPPWRPAIATRNRPSSNPLAPPYACACF